MDSRDALRELGERLDGPLADEADNIVKAGLLSVRAEVYRLLGELGMAAAASRLEDKLHAGSHESPSQGHATITADTRMAAVFDQWYVNVLTPYADQVELAATPLLDADGAPFTAASGQAFVVPIGAEHPSAACAWMLELTSEDAWMAAGEARAETTAAEPERNGINAGLFTGSPAADEAVRTEFVQPTEYPGFDETIQAYYDVAAEGVSFGATPAGQQLQSELQDAVISALLGEASPEDALADAQDAAMRAYEQVAGG